MSVIETVQVARSTDRKCDDCREPLPKGRKYRRHVAPPKTDDLDNEFWWTLTECWDCANRNGRPIDPDQYPPKLAVEAWNERHPIGTPVRYVNFPGDPWRETTTASAAFLTDAGPKLLGGACIWLEGVGGWWALSHVEAVEA